MTKLQVPGVNLVVQKAEHVAAAAGRTVGQGFTTPATPAYCRIDGVIDPRTGVNGRSYGIGFALALPDDWNGRFLFQGGGGLNGSVGMPLGAQAAGDVPGLARGFAVVSTDSGHKGQGFDSSFFEDQEAGLNFYYLAIGRVATLSKEIIGRYYGKPAAHSYFSGCSTGGREAMIMSQRYPNYFDGIVVGDPAMRTGHSNMTLAYIGSVYDENAPRDASGKPDRSKLFSESDKKLILTSLLNACDAQDGLKDGMIFDNEGCRFDPAVLTCKGEKNDSCLSAHQVTALKALVEGTKDSRGATIYPGFPLDAGLADGGGIKGLLYGPQVPVKLGIDLNQKFDAEREAARLVEDSNSRLGDSTFTNLTTYKQHGGKLIYYHGTSDAWFSPMETFGYYKRMIAQTGGEQEAPSWARFFFVPGMGHCAGGSATLDHFDMLKAIMDWVENGVAPESVVATGRAFPGRSRPLCAYPKHAQYKGNGDPQDAKNFSCE
jgi:feruloyl esterase